LIIDHCHWGVAEVAAAIVIIGIAIACLFSGCRPEQKQAGTTTTTTAAATDRGHEKSTQTVTVFFYRPPRLLYHCQASEGPASSDLSHERYIP
jgi:hypothetical protein